MCLYNNNNKTDVSHRQSGRSRSARQDVALVHTQRVLHLDDERRSRRALSRSTQDRVRAEDSSSSSSSSRGGGDQERQERLALATRRAHSPPELRHVQLVLAQRRAQARHRAHRDRSARRGAARGALAGQRRLGRLHTLEFGRRQRRVDCKICSFLLCLFFMFL